MRVSWRDTCRNNGVEPRLCVDGPPQSSDASPKGNITMKHVPRLALVTVICLFVALAAPLFAQEPSEAEEQSLIWL